MFERDCDLNWYKTIQVCGYYKAAQFVQFIFYYISIYDCKIIIIAVLIYYHHYYYTKIQILKNKDKIRNITTVIFHCKIKKYRLT